MLIFPVCFSQEKRVSVCFSKPQGLGNCLLVPEKIFLLFIEEHGGLVIWFITLGSVVVHAVRVGELLFESFDIGRGWDGTYMGNPCQIEVYVWKLDWISTDAQEMKTRNERVGTVTLIK